MRNTVIFFVLLFGIKQTQCQTHSHAGAQPLAYPDINGYVTLKTDLHMHSVFSDGNVWPTIRVQEALRENLDAISLTEHLEYQPHKEDIPHPDRNRAYHLAQEEAGEHDLLIVPGSEITRSAPIGHSNAVFVTDANTLVHEEANDAFAAAKNQGAFVFWNHPAWHGQNPSGTPILSDFQEQLIKNGQLQGIEVINSGDYAEESLALALANNLTIMGTSDIHGLIDWDYTEKGHHRPITLVFAKEKNLESLKEALFAGKTVAVYNDLLVGKAEYLKPLLQASIHIQKAVYVPDTEVVEIQLQNVTSSDLLFENMTDFTFYDSSPVFLVPAGQSKVIHLKTLEKLGSFDLKLKALGAYTEPKVHPIIDWNVTVE